MRGRTAVYVQGHRDSRCLYTVHTHTRTHDTGHATRPPPPLPPPPPPPQVREYLQVVDAKDETVKDGLYEEAVILKRREQDYRWGLQ